MAIVKMNKFTLLTFESKRNELIKKIQELSKVEFINLQDEKILEDNQEFKDLSKYNIDSEYSKYEENLSKTKSALTFLEKYSPKKSGIKALMEGKIELTLNELEKKVESSNWIDSYNKVKEKENIIANLDMEITKLKNEIETLGPWESLDVAFEELDNLKKTTYFLGTIPKIYEETLLEKLSNSYIEIISRNSKDTNILLLTNKEHTEEVSEILREVGFSNFKTEHKEVPMKLILDWKHEIEELQSKKFFIKEEVSGYEEDLKNLQLVYDYYENKIRRMKVSNNFLKTKNVSAIQGWIAEEDKSELEGICNKVLGKEYYLEFEEVKEEEIDDVPIKLKNGKLVSAFESVTSMYSYPKYNEIDPTPLLTPFYLIFFGMMIADAGYGLIVLISSFLAMKFLKLDKGMKDFMQFFFYLSITTIFFGLIYGSFFGDALVLPTQILNPNKDVNSILILSIALGVIQIFVGLGIKAYISIKAGSIKDAIYDSFSWMLTLISLGGIAGVGLLNLPSILKTVFTITAIIGMAIIVLTNGRDAKSKGAQIASGTYALYNITGYVGDLVSYTRLMALGLSGGSIAGALNLLISTLPGVAAIIIGPVLFILAHIFNLALSLLGAYVHTARLQYVEYFGKFYDGGGKPFRAFEVSGKYVNIKRN